MRFARALSLSSLAMLAAITGALTTACERRAPGEAPAAAQSSAAPSAAESANRKAPGVTKIAAPRGDDRFAAQIAANLPRVPDPAIQVPEGGGAGAALDNGVFRDRVIAFVRQVAAGGDKVTCDLPLSSKRPFRAVVWGYRDGKQIARGEASDAGLCVALKDAARRAVAAAGGAREALAGARLVVELPDHHESMVEHQGKGVELTHGLVPVRVLDKALLQRRIEDGERYLLRVIDPAHKGVHKYYHAPVDRFEPELHTIYSASTAFTLLKLNAYRPDERLLRAAKDAAGFMMRMQSHEQRDRTAGAFFYAFDLERQRPERRLVVGTASKSIFTLLELHALTKEKRYLESAVLAATWLVSMQRPDGSVRSVLTGQAGGAWKVQGKESMLYTGQVLSALSRTYRATKDRKFLDAAAQTAGYLLGKISTKGCYLGDDYRKPNPISSSWAVLSLLDFARASGEERFEQAVFRCADDLLRRQWRRPEDVYRYGRWQRSRSSSGNGWLAEVMSEVYLYCREEGRGGCAPYKDATIAAIRLLLQYTYGPDNAFVVKNPKAAEGGVFWSVRDRYVRTDSVCHAMNAYLNVVGELGDGPLLELPERPLAERMALAAEAADAAQAAGVAEDEREERDEAAAGQPSRGPSGPRGEDPDDEEGSDRGPAARQP
ncbi:prenyltransferase UbiA [Sorangium cellulosum]|uniref:Prenyltransferase UbiA n=1 Tax=Sorangium cellulosum TaxID=56 RepID=A0A4V0NCY2_SORCE|nr:terpene cyclase [Sorangium cellulosum]AUX20762.1 prenyltransferase UbiA [Sorangium cellulosum]